jgi:hypothetical protein
MIMVWADVLGAAHAPGATLQGTHNTSHNVHRKIESVKHVHRFTVGPVNPLILLPLARTWQLQEA